MDIHVLTHFVTDKGLVDAVLFVLGVLLGTLSRFRLPITIAIIMFRAFQWYMKTHPHGQELAENTNADEKLDKIYTDKLGKNDVLTASCGGAGNTPNLSGLEVG